MKILWVAGLCLMAACGKLISIPGLNAKNESEGKRSPSARISIATDSTANTVTALVQFQGKVFKQTCMLYGASITYKNNGQDINSAYIKERRTGYFYNGNFIQPHFDVFPNGSCDVVQCVPLGTKSFELSHSLVFVKEEPPRPVPSDYLAQLEKIRNKLDLKTYEEFAALKVLDAYADVIYRGRYALDIYGIFKDESCENSLNIASDFNY